MIYEHPEFILIDKPAGVSVHKDDAQSSFLIQLSEQRNEPLWLVHRLDKLTSGLLLLARSQRAASQLSQQFAERRVDKLYLAVSADKPKRKQGLISGDMKPARRGSWKLVRSRENPAQTEFISIALAPGKRLILCHPLTGKTHQIRVALKSEGAPVFGDGRYSRDVDADRGYLHAWQLGFCFDGTPYRFRADPLTGLWFKMALENGVLDSFNLPQHWDLPLLNESVEHRERFNHG